MAIACPDCGKEYDVTLFQFGRKVRCECGRWLDASQVRPSGGPPAPSEAAERVARLKMAELQRMADRVCVLILNSEYPDIDIEIEKAKVRERCQQLFPDRMYLYDMIYESRFRRLWEQFREAERTDEPWR